jgi:hypothetical protein
MRSSGALAVLTDSGDLGIEGILLSRAEHWQLTGRPAREGARAKDDCRHSPGS